MMYAIRVVKAGDRVSDQLMPNEMKQQVHDAQRRNVAAKARILARQIFGLVVMRLHSSTFAPKTAA